MDIPTKHRLLAQQLLNKHSNAKLLEDGIFGTKSVAAAILFTSGMKMDGAMTTERWIAATVQRAAYLEGNREVALDGWWGPQTRDAAYRLMGQTYARPDECVKAGCKKTHPLDVRCWVPTDRQMIDRFGQVGKNQKKILLPFPMRLDWDTSTVVTSTTGHAMFEKPLTGALEEIRDVIGLDTIRALNIDRFGGVLNVRRKRGGSTWSTHAWGVAIDLWPSANQLSWKRNRAAFARAEYKPMRDAFSRAGLLSLGTCYDFDWMHWQLNP